jgi:putative toxin-antitoxin system antitoxin component (TIGR02293 family)
MWHKFFSRMAKNQTFLLKLLTTGGVRYSSKPTVAPASFAAEAPDDTLTLHEGAAAMLFGPEQLIARVRAGLPARAFGLLADTLEVSAERLARLLHIAPRTLARRDVFKPDESDRILRLSCLFQRACDVLGGEPEARHWLQAPQWALGGALPLEFADTEPGTREVERLLGRIEHGVVA